MLFEVGDEVRVRQPTNLFHSELGKVVSIDHVKLVYKVVFHRGNSDVYTCFDLILVKRQGETSMKFKVGDKVKVKDSWRGNSGKVGTISRAGWGTMYKYRVEFEDADPEAFKEEELELVKEEEKEMEFKVGDKVRMIRNTCGNRGKIGTLEKIDTSTMPYHVVFDDGRKEWCHGHEFKLLREETSMKFKVGDKVKVKDSWFGRDGQVGVVFKVDNLEPYNYNIKFDTEGDNERRDENFMGDSLELAKQSFTKSDLKTGMGVVLRDGSKGHVLLGTEAGDVIRFINGGSNQWASVDEYDENMIDCDTSAVDIIEVYSSRFAYACLTDRVFNQDCVFKREEPKSEPKPEPEPTKMTMKEINEHFGKAIEVIE